MDNLDIPSRDAHQSLTFGGSFMLDCGVTPPTVPVSYRTYGALNAARSHAALLRHDPPFDLAIPGMVAFRTLPRAQALGDFESLDKRNRRGVRVHFTTDVKAGLAALASALETAVSAKA